MERESRQRSIERQVRIAVKWALVPRHGLTQRQLVKTLRAVVIIVLLTLSLVIFHALAPE
jgi:hypothetical protein